MFLKTKKINVECPVCKSEIKISTKDIKSLNIVLCDSCNCKIDIGNINSPQNLKEIEQSFLKLIR